MRASATVCTDVGESATITYSSARSLVTMLAMVDAQLYFTLQQWCVSKHDS